MGAHTQRLGHALPAATTVLRRERGRHRDHSTPGACCLGFEDGTECGPAGITDALGQVSVAHQVGDPQIFELDRVVQPEQRQRGLVVKVGVVPLHRLVRPLQVAHSRAAALAALLATRTAALGLLQAPLRMAVVAWIRYVRVPQRR
jgi:hypothetical protein